MRFPLEQTDTLSVISPRGDLYNNSPESEAVDITNYHEAVFTLHKNQGASPGEGLLEVFASELEDKSNPVAVPFKYSIDNADALDAEATGLAIPADTASIIRVQPNLHAVGEVGTFVFATLTEVTDGALAGSMTFEGFSKRYGNA